MDPFTLAAIGLAVAGSATSIFGSSQANDANQQILAAQMQSERIRKKAMELDARRRTLEAVRMGQRAHAQALSNATNQGAQAGSGLQGGYGQISGATGFNLLGVFQNLQLGRQMFNANQAATEGKMDLASAQSIMAIGSSLGSLGGTVLQNLPALKNMFPGTSTKIDSSSNYAIY